MPCFTLGTLISTPRGDLVIENLRVGDLVVTRDRGIKEIRWIGIRPMNYGDFAAHPHLKPVYVPKGGIVGPLPEQEMLVAPNLRFLVPSDRTALPVNGKETLVAAKHLTRRKGPRSVDAAVVTYVHFYCDQHEIVLANGSWCEAFHPGDRSQGASGNAQRAELFEIFPELQDPDGLAGHVAARRRRQRQAPRSPVE